MSKAGWIVADKGLEEWELRKLGAEIFATENQALAHLKSTIHRAFWDAYEVKYFNF